MAAGLGVALLLSSGDVAHQALMVIREATGTHVPNEHQTIAKALSNAGLRPGDQVGVIGSALKGYWARLAGVRITAEIPPYESQKYWGATDSVHSAVHAAFWKSGVRAIVASGRGVRDDLPGWQPLPVKGYFVTWPAGP